MNTAKWDYNDPKLPDNTLAYDKCDEEFKMRVKWGATICTIITDDDGNEMHLTDVYKGKEKLVVCYKRV